MGEEEEETQDLGTVLRVHSGGSAQSVSLLPLITTLVLRVPASREPGVVDGMAQKGG